MFTDPSLGFLAPWGGLSHAAVTEFVTADPLAFDAEATRRRLSADAVVPQSMASHAVAVLSHEALSSRPHHGFYYAPYVAQRLKATFPKARLLLIFREQKSIIRSLYGEHVRNGGRMTISEFVGTGHEPPGWASLCRLPFFEYDRLISMYRNVFGDENVLVLPLETLRNSPLEFLNRILAFCDLPDAAWVKTEAANKSWGASTVELIRKLNAPFRKRPLSPDQGLLRRTAFRAAYLFDDLTPPSLHARREADIRNIIAERVGDYFGRSNLRLAEMTGLDLRGLGYDLPKANDPSGSATVMKRDHAASITGSI
ncbi:MAG: hypothetical protein AAF933_11095 [Pseudomonadota bacterium]